MFAWADERPDLLEPTVVPSVESISKDSKGKGKAVVKPPASKSDEAVDESEADMGSPSGQPSPQSTHAGGDYQAEGESDAESDDVRPPKRRKSASKLSSFPRV